MNALGVQAQCLICRCLSRFFEDAVATVALRVEPIIIFAHGVFYHEPKKFVNKFLPCFGEKEKPEF